MRRPWVLGWVALVAVFVVVFWAAGRDREELVPADLIGYEAQGTALTVAYLAGTGEGCAEPAGVRVTEDDDRVVVTAQVRYTGGERVCGLAAKHHRETVTLRRPLGGRVVVDGAGRPLPPLSGASPTSLPNA